jgi:hypothetical protein
MPYFAARRISSALTRNFHRQASGSRERHDFEQRPSAAAVRKTSVTLMGRHYELHTQISQVGSIKASKCREVIEKRLELDSSFREAVEKSQTNAQKSVQRTLEYLQNDASRLNPEKLFSYGQNSHHYEMILSKSNQVHPVHIWLQQGERPILWEEEEKLPEDNCAPQPLICSESDSLFPKKAVWMVGLRDNFVPISWQAYRSEEKQFEISLWGRVESGTGIEEEDAQSIQQAGAGLHHCIGQVRHWAQENFARALTCRRQPLSVNAIKASMKIEGRLPLSADIFISSDKIYEIVALATGRPENDAEEVEAAFQKAAMEERRSASFQIGGEPYIYYGPCSGPFQDIGHIMSVQHRVRITKRLIEMAEEGCQPNELRLLEKWERRRASTPSILKRVFSMFY